MKRWAWLLLLALPACHRSDGERERPPADEVWLTWDQIQSGNVKTVTVAEREIPQVVWVRSLVPKLKKEA